MTTAKRRLYEARYRAENKDKLRLAQRAYYKKNAARIKARQAAHGRARRLRRYGLTAEHEQALLAAQGGACAICASKTPKGNGGKAWHVDHDHDSCSVRGLLCQPCNLVLGHAKDSVTVLKSAIKYLQKHQKTVKLNNEISQLI